MSVRRAVIAAVMLAASAGVAGAGWSPAWTNGSIWAHGSLMRDLISAVDERHGVVYGDSESYGFIDTIWPSIYNLDRVDLWITSEAQLPGQPYSWSYAVIPYQNWLDPYKAISGSYSNLWATNGVAWLTWTNAMKYIGLTNTYNFTRPCVAFDGGYSTNRPFWLRREDMNERKALLNLLRWSQDTLVYDKVEKWSRRWSLMDWESGVNIEGESCTNFVAPAATPDYGTEWTDNGYVQDWRWSVIYHRANDELWTGDDANAVYGEAASEAWRIPKPSEGYNARIAWWSETPMGIGTDLPTNLAARSDFYLLSQTGVVSMAGSTTTNWMLLSWVWSDSEWDCYDGKQSDSEPMYDEDEQRVNTQTNCAWSLPRAWSLVATADKKRANGCTAVTNTFTGWPVRADLQYTIETVAETGLPSSPAGASYDRQESMYVGPKAWNIGGGSQYLGSVRVVHRWDVTNGFDKVGPLP